MTMLKYFSPLRWYFWAILGLDALLSDSALADNSVSGVANNVNSLVPTLIKTAEYVFAFIGVVLVGAGFLDLYKESHGGGSGGKGKAFTKIIVGVVLIGLFAAITFISTSLFGSTQASSAFSSQSP